MVFSFEKKLSISIKRNELAYVFCCADMVANTQVTPTTLKCAAGTRVSGIVDAAIFVNKLIGRWW